MSLTPYEIVMAEADRIQSIPIKDQPSAVEALVGAAKRIRDETNWLGLSYYKDEA